MKNNKKKVAVILLAAMITGAFGFFLYFGMGVLPVIGKIIAINKLNEYSETPIDSITFDWLNNKYVCSSNSGNNLSYRLRYNAIHDGRMSNEISNTANQRYLSIKNDFPSNLTLPESIFVWTEINADDYSVKSQRIYLLGVYNSDKLTEEQSLGMPVKIAELLIELMGDEYSFTGIQLIYADTNGMYEIAIRSDGYQLLQYQNFDDSIRKFSENELPLDYIEWLKQHSD